MKFLSRKLFTEKDGPPEGGRVRQGEGDSRALGEIPYIVSYPPKKHNMCYPLGVAKPDRKAWLMVSGHLKNQLPRGETEPASMSCAVVPLTTGDRKPEREAAGKVIASHNSGRGTDSA